LLDSMTALDRRRSGILLHPTSLPGPHGSGDFGPGAYHFIDWLQSAGQSVWQMLPLNPIGPGNSPYASVSAFAGSPLLVALEPLVDKGWLAPIDAAEIASFSAERIDFGRVPDWRMAKLRGAAENFFARADAADRGAFATYCNAQAHWLDDYALFMALDESTRAARGFTPWTRWDAPLARRNPRALAEAHRRHAKAVDFAVVLRFAVAGGAPLRERARHPAGRRPADLCRAPFRRLLDAPRPVPPR